MFSRLRTRLLASRPIPALPASALPRSLAPARLLSSSTCASAGTCPSAAAAAAAPADSTALPRPQSPRPSSGPEGPTHGHSHGHGHGHGHGPKGHHGGHHRGRAPLPVSPHAALDTAGRRDKVHLYGLTREDVERELAAIGINPSRANDLFKAVYVHGCSDLTKLPNFAYPLRRALNERFTLGSATALHTARSRDGTRKLLIGLPKQPGKGTSVETVYIPAVGTVPFTSANRSHSSDVDSDSDRDYSHNASSPNIDTATEVAEAADAAEAAAADAADLSLLNLSTPLDLVDRGALCVSSQVGCSLQCAFCHTGTMPKDLLRNLTAAEIVAQVVLAKREVGDYAADRSEKNKLSEYLLHQRRLRASEAEGEVDANASADDASDAADAGASADECAHNEDEADVVHITIGSSSSSTGDGYCDADGVSADAKSGGCSAPSGSKAPVLRRARSVPAPSSVAAAVASQSVSHVVFMGMGEPGYNHRAVATAIKVLTDPSGLALARRRVTVSTSGVVPVIDKLGTELGVSLAISLHSVRDEIRDVLVPINKQWPLKSLIEACRRYPAARHSRPITFEYVMLDGVNDSDEDARELVRLLKGIPALVNLIPFNPWPGAGFNCSPDARILEFQRIVSTASDDAAADLARAEVAEREAAAAAQVAKAAAEVAMVAAIAAAASIGAGAPLATNYTSADAAAAAALAAAAAQTAKEAKSARLAATAAAAGIRCSIRVPRGRDILAACGQLAVLKEAENATAVAANIGGSWKTSARAGVEAASAASLTVDDVEIDWDGHGLGVIRHKSEPVANSNMSANANTSKSAHAHEVYVNASAHNQSPSARANANKPRNSNNSNNNNHQQQQQQHRSQSSQIQRSQPHSQPQSPQTATPVAPTPTRATAPHSTSSGSDRVGRGADRAHTHTTLANGQRLPTRQVESAHQFASAAKEARSAAAAAAASAAAAAATNAAASDVATAAGADVASAAAAASVK